MTAGSRWLCRRRQRVRHTASMPGDKARAVSQMWMSTPWLFSAADRIKSPAEYRWEWHVDVSSNPKTDTEPLRTLFLSCFTFRLLWIKNKKIGPIGHFYHLLVRELIYVNIFKAVLQYIFAHVLKPLQQNAVYHKMCPNDISTISLTCATHSA